RPPAPDVRPPTGPDARATGDDRESDSHAVVLPQPRTRRGPLHEHRGGHPVHGARHDRPPPPRPGDGHPAQTVEGGSVAEGGGDASWSRELVMRAGHASWGTLAAPFLLPFFCAASRSSACPHLPVGLPNSPPP